MSFASLRDFIAYLEKKGDLVRIKEPVSTELEITEIHRRVLKEKGPALLFENVYTPHGSSEMPIFTNLFGTVERIAHALKRKPEELRELGELLAFLKQPEPPRSFKESLGLMPILKQVLSMRPKMIKKAPCQEVIDQGDNVDLTRLPIQTCWPNEPAPLITWGLVVTKGPSDEAEDSYNLGIYRMQALDKKTTLMRWLKHRGGAIHHQRWKQEKREPLPAAVIIGCDPATILAAVTPIPSTMSEYDFASLLRGKSLPLVKCKTIPIAVPANAEIILEGHISLNEYGEEGPYGDHTGYYNSVELFPKFHVSAITTRKDPIYLTTYTSRPPDEPSVLGVALNELFIPLLQKQYPEIVDFYLPPEGCSYRIAVVSIKKSYPGHAKRIMMGIWSFLTQFMYTKFIYVVDNDINVRSWDDVMWAVSTRMDPKRDIVMIENTPIDYLDFASPESGLGSKVGFDATNKIPPETHREWGEKMAMDSDIVEKVSKHWHKYGLK